MPDFDRLSDLTERQRDAFMCGDLMRWLSCSITVKGDPFAAAELFVSKHPRALHTPTVRSAIAAYRTKAVTLAGDQTTWGSDLGVQPPTGPLMKLVRAESILGKLQGARRVPFNSSVPRQIGTTGTFTWIGPTAPKPATRLSFDSLTLAPTKIGGLVAISGELAKLAVNGAEAAMIDALVGALVSFQDQQFTDPAIGQIDPNTRPKSITSGLTPVTNTGGGVTKDVAALLKTFYTNCPGAIRPSLLMSPAVAGQLCADGHQPQLTVAGGTAFGVPTVTSSGCGQNVVALDAAELAYADGELRVDASDQVTLELDAQPSSTAASILTSFWSANLVSLRTERTINYSATPGSVAYLVAA